MKFSLFMQMVGVTALWLSPLFYVTFQAGRARGRKVGHAKGVKEGFLDGRRSERRYQD